MSEFDGVRTAADTEHRVKTMDVKKSASGNQQELNEQIKYCETKRRPHATERDIVTFFIVTS